MPDQPLPKPWRHVLRLSVRGLMILVLLFGGGLGWIVFRARVQREAVWRSRAPGSQVVYDWEWKKFNSGSGTDPWWPKWLLDGVGLDYFYNVAEVAFKQ